jgi:flagellar basal body-associated protein FliL
MKQSKYKKWLINILILVMAIVLMLAVAEFAMRWIDGYQLTTIELEQNTGE